MRKNYAHYFAILILILILASCANPTPPATPEATATEAVATSAEAAASPVEPTSTSDPCLRPQLETEVQEVHSHMREFDDASILASNMPREQLSGAIADLQRIRREAEDEETPGCLTNLKAIQVQHMNSVINTLIAFMGGRSRRIVPTPSSTSSVTNSVTGGTLGHDHRSQAL